MVNEEGVEAQGGWMPPAPRDAGREGRGDGMGYWGWWVRVIVGGWAHTGADRVQCGGHFQPRGRLDWLPAVGAAGRSNMSSAAAISSSARARLEDVLWELSTLRREAGAFGLGPGCPPPWLCLVGGQVKSPWGSKFFCLIDGVGLGFRVRPNLYI